MLLSANVTNVADINGPRTTFAIEGGLRGLVVGNSTLPALTYNVTGDFVISEGSVLRLLPGTTLQLGSGLGITVEGTLLAEGNATHPITITCLKNPNAKPYFIGCYYNYDVYSNYFYSTLSSNGVVSADNPNMTVDWCLSFCTTRGYSYAGLWSRSGTPWLHNCICSTYNPGASNRYANTSCSHACPGNTTQTCGNSYYMSLWRTTTCDHWDRISFGSKSNNSAIRFANIEYGGGASQGGLSMIYSTTSDLIVEDTNLTYSGGNGLQIAGGGRVMATLRRLRVTLSNLYGVMYTDASLPKGFALDSNYFGFNGLSGFYATCSGYTCNTNMSSTNNVFEGNGYGFLLCPSTTLSHGAFYIEVVYTAATLFMTNNTFVRNYNPWALMLYYTQANVDSNFFISNGLVQDDTALYIRYPPNYYVSYVTRNMFLGNRNAFYYYSQGYSMINVNNNTFTMNTGRNIFQHYPRYGYNLPHYVVGNTFTNNTVVSSGLVMYVEACCPDSNPYGRQDLLFLGNTFINNSVVGGSVVYLRSSSQPQLNGTFNGNVLTDNVAVNTLVLDPGSFTVNNKRWNLQYNIFVNPNASFEVTCNMPDRNSPVVATNSYWGYDRDNLISMRISDALENSARERVEYFPYLLTTALNSAILTNATRDTIRQADGSLGGFIARDMVLTAASPGPVYNVSSPIVVGDNATLVIEAGVTLRLMPDTGMIVKGQLIAQGTAVTPVKFDCVPNPNTTWTYAGCYYEYDPNSNTPVDMLIMFGIPKMSFVNITIDVCVAHCERFGYTYAGLWSYFVSSVWQERCLCGNYNPGTYQKQAESSCNHPCSGNTSQTCGGSYRMSLYRTRACDHWGQLSLGPQSRSSILQYVTLTSGGNNGRVGTASLDIQTSAAAMSYLSITRSSGHAVWAHPISSPDTFAISYSNFSFNSMSGIILTDSACQFSCQLDSIVADSNGMSGIFNDMYWVEANRGSIPLIRACNISNSGLMFPMPTGIYANGYYTNAGIRLYGNRATNKVVVR